MGSFKIVFLIAACNVAFSSCFRPLYKHVPRSAQGSAGETLFLTPLIEAGKIDEAQNKATVPPLKGQVKSYAGYLTVNRQYQSNMFFWFFPAEQNYEKAPVVLWLQGGPGSSSLFALFYENGPYSIRKKRLRLRNYSWTKEHSVLYIDNPVGTGYSFTNDTRGYAKNQRDVGRDLYSALLQFFTLFPKLQKNDFYVTGESYGGKYVPAIAYTIHENSINNASFQINLKGVAIGNGLVDPENMLDYGSYLYQLGLLDSKWKEVFAAKENQIRQLIQNQEWKKASDGFTELIDSDPSQPSLFQQATGLNNYFNYIATSPETDDLSNFIQEDRVREAIHVGNATWNDGSAVQYYLAEDITKSTRPWVEELLSAYKVLIYNGQLDIICAYPLTENYLKKLNWTDMDVYKDANRSTWSVDGAVAGYVKTAGNLMDVMVRDAGHMVPTDRPAEAYHLIRNFTRNLPL